MIGVFINLRIDFACRQLVSPDIPMVRVALSAGFSDQSQFTKAFRRQMEMTPGEFRRHFGTGVRPRNVSLRQDVPGFGPYIDPSRPLGDRLRVTGSYWRNNFQGSPAPDRKDEVSR